MYEHLVVFRFNDLLTAEKEDELLGMLLGLKGEIPGIAELTAGRNVTEETDNRRGYAIGLRVTFESKEALQAYGPHPAHQRFVRALDGLLDNVVVVDYPIV
ncbi:Dabb family protein [Paenibacillus sp. CC-CFT747]|nr:Dabb family protein [Paenibacillus sp. CC-CFT747]